MATYSSANTAVYPGAIASFTTKYDSDPTILAVAQDVNRVQDEVAAIQATLGLRPAGQYATFQDRLAAGWWANAFAVNGNLTDNGTIPTAGQWRLTVTWVRSRTAKAPALVFRGYRITLGAPHPLPLAPGDGPSISGNFLAEREIAENAPPVDFSLCDAPRLTLYDCHHHRVLNAGDRVFVSGVVVFGGSVYQPMLMARRIPT